MDRRTKMTRFTRELGQMIPRVCQDYPETRSNVTMANVQSGPSAYQMHTECGRESAHGPTVSGNGRQSVHSYRVEKFPSPIYFPIIISWSRSKT